MKTEYYKLLISALDSGFIWPCSSVSVGIKIGILRILRLTVYIPGFKDKNMSCKTKGEEAVHTAHASI